MAKPTKEDAKDIVAKLLASKVITREDIADITDQSKLNDITDMFHTLMCGLPHESGLQGACMYYMEGSENISRKGWKKHVQDFMTNSLVSEKEMVEGLRKLGEMLSTIEGTPVGRVADLLLREYYSSHKVC